MTTTATPTHSSSIDVHIPGSFPKDPHTAIDHLADAIASQDIASESTDPAATIQRAADMASKFLPQSVAGALGLEAASQSVPTMRGFGASPSQPSSNSCRSKDTSEHSVHLKVRKMLMIPFTASAMNDNALTAVDVAPAVQKTLTSVSASADDSGTSAQKMKSDYAPYAEKAPASHEYVESEAPSIEQLEVSNFRLPTYAAETAATDVAGVDTAALPFTNQYQNPLVAATLASTDPNSAQPFLDNGAFATNGSEGEYATNVGLAAATLVEMGAAALAEQPHAPSPQIRHAFGGEPGFLIPSAPDAASTQPASVADIGRAGYIPLRSDPATPALEKDTGFGPVAGTGLRFAGAGIGRQASHEVTGSKIKDDLRTPSLETSPGQIQCSSASEVAAPTHAADAKDTLVTSGSEPVTAEPETEKSGSYKDPAAAGATAVGFGTAYALYDKNKDEKLATGQNQTFDTKDANFGMKQTQRAQKEPEEGQKRHEKEVAEEKAHKDAERQEARRAKEVKEAEKEEKREEREAAAIVAAEAKEAKKAEKDCEKEEKRLAKEVAAVKEAQEKREKEAEKERKMHEREAAAAVAAIAAEEKRKKKKAEEEEKIKAKEAKQAQKEEKRHEKEVAAAIAAEEKESKKAEKEREKAEKRKEKEVMAAGAAIAAEEEKRRKQAEKDAKEAEKAQKRRDKEPAAVQAAKVKQEKEAEEVQKRQERERAQDVKRHEAASAEVAPAAGSGLAVLVDETVDHSDEMGKQPRGLLEEHNHLEIEDSNVDPQHPKEGLGSRVKTKIAAVFHHHHDHVEDDVDAPPQMAEMKDEEDQRVMGAAAGLAIAHPEHGLQNANAKTSNTNDINETEDSTDDHKSGLKGIIASLKQEEPGSQPIGSPVVENSGVSARPPLTTLGGEGRPQSGTDSDFPLTMMDRVEAVDITGTGAPAALASRQPLKEDRSRYGGVMPSNSAHGRRSMESARSSGSDRSSEERKSHAKHLLEKVKEIINS